METKPLTDLNGTTFAPQTNIASIVDLSPELDKRAATAKTFTLEKTKEIINRLDTDGKIIFDGQNYFTDKQSYTYSQADLKMGIALVFERYDPQKGTRLGYGQTTVYYPKQVLRTIYTISQDVVVNTVMKTFTIYNDHIVGYKDNELGQRQKMILRRIILI